MKFGAIGICLLVSSVAQAVPTSFLLQEPGNQNDVEWQTVETSRFRVYHDKEAEHLARFGLSSLESAWPYYKQIFSVRLPSEEPLEAPSAKEIVSRFETIPVVINSRVDVGGFANPFTQNIEVQLKNGSDATLFQHELVHRAMYERLDPLLGPAGRGFVLAMVPTWWIEGTAEYLTESVGRLETEGLIRFQALENYWPTWDSLHNLYSKGGDYGRGYATSGRFFGFLMSKAGGRSLGDVQDEMFRGSIMPPFVNAVNRALSTIWQKSGEELYEEFKARNFKRVRDELDDMPSFAKGAVQERYLSSTGVMRSRLFGELIVTPELNSSPYPSALLVTDIKTGRTTRAVVNVEGGYVSDVESFTSASPSELSGAMATVWSSKSQLFGNGVRGDQLLYISMGVSGSGKAAASQNFVNEMNLSSESAPWEILQIEARGKGRAFIHGNLRGDSAIFLADKTDGTLKELRRWPAGTALRLLKHARQASGDSRRDCVRLIIGNEGERTSVQRLCANGQLDVIVAEGRYSIRDGIETSDGNMTLLAGWGNVQGLLRIQSDEFVGGFPFPDWVGGIFPWGTDSDGIGVWMFKGDGYRMVSISWKKALEQYRKWASGLGDNSPWRQIPRWQIHIPPFVRLAALDREAQDKRSDIFDNRRLREKSSYLVPKGGGNGVGSVQKTDAPQRLDHLFTYPYLYPSVTPFLSGFTVGVGSIPFQDEMERQSLRLYAQYNSPSGMYSLNAAYLNNRWFDGFELSTFLQPRFNGYYYWIKGQGAEPKWRLSHFPGDKGTSYRWESYLQESGIQVATAHKLWPSSVVVTPFLRVAALEPYNAMSDKREISFIGAQRSMLGTAGLSLSSSLGEKAFYAGDPATIGEPYLVWTNRGSVSIETNRSLAKTFDYLYREVSPISYERYRMNLSSSLLYDEKSLVLRGNLGMTSGSSTMNYREFYEPYKTYLLGSGSGLNNLNYFLLNSEVFGRMVGAHSFGTSLAYGFPLVSEIDKQLLILYFSSLRGELVVNHGGVARDESFKDTRSISSASFSAKATIDVKGFQIFPSVAFGRTLNRNGWVLFSELSFSDFF